MKTFQEKELSAFEEDILSGDLPLNIMSIKNWVKRHDARLLEEINKSLPKTKYHICRFNDGHCVCECYNEYEFKMRELLKSLGTSDLTEQPHE